MDQYVFTDNMGSFRVENPELTSYLYFPVAGESGVMSSVTPYLGGDSKTGQDTFLLEPVSSENLHNNKSSRNFWVKMKSGDIWSATGKSGAQQAEKFTADKEKTVLEAGIMWHRIIRESNKYGLSSEITTFVPNTEDQIELTMVTLNNTGNENIELIPIAATPIYGRSADNIRDHRNVTSMLHRIKTVDNGVVVSPTLAFDERGHNVNTEVYGVFGRGNGKLPVGFIPIAEDFIGEGGDYENPKALYEKEIQCMPAGEEINGWEAMGAIVFEEICLKPGEKAVYIIALGYGKDSKKLPQIADLYLTEESFSYHLNKTKTYWTDKVNISYQSGNKNFDNWMYWVNFQPMLRRIYGCSFLPHHDYGRGGRGWRDLWQDCLALLLMNPSGVREMLLSNFGGVRMDGTNATIIGNGQGEFIADRNGITRVWMDHGMWPFMTVFLYIKQSGDWEFMLEEAEYFKDAQAFRGEQVRSQWTEEERVQTTVKNEVYKGTVLEHVLIQHLTAFYDVGSHNHMQIRGADWNDALDMADENGESVAFTAAYAGNMEDLAQLILHMNDKKIEKVVIAEELKILLEDREDLYNSIDKKKQLLQQYCAACKDNISGVKIEVDAVTLANNLRNKSRWMKEHIRSKEWIQNKEGFEWFNSYYDNDKNPLEGDNENGVRVMLTGQVFAIMSATATKQQVEKITKTADKYLYAPEVGGYRLNTDFKEIKMNMGRMFGFAYGQKENGAVFCHMAVMYGNALYRAGFVKEGYKVIHSLYEHASNTSLSNIYPGIPEYFDPKGRGVYHYLTGAASWLLLTVLTEMFGVKGDYGNLKLEPKLLAKQFDEKKEAAVRLTFAGKKLLVTYSNPLMKSYGEYEVKGVDLNGQRVSGTEAIIEKQHFLALEEDKEHVIVVTLS